MYTVLAAFMLKLNTGNSIEFKNVSDFLNPIFLAWNSCKYKVQTAFYGFAKNNEKRDYKSVLREVFF